MVVSQSPQRFASNGGVGYAPGRVGKQSEKSGSIGSRKIQAVVEFARREGKPLWRIGNSSTSDQSPVDSGDCREQFARAVADDESQFRIRELLSNGRNRRHGQDQVADPFELEEEEVQPAWATFCIAAS